MLESKKYGSNAKTPKFVKKEDAYGFMEELLQRGYFFRAKKLVLKKKDDKKEDKKKEKELDSKSPKSSKKSKSDLKETETALVPAADGKMDKKEQKDSVFLLYLINNIINILGRRFKEKEKSQANCT